MSLLHFFDSLLPYQFYAKTELIQERAVHLDTFLFSIAQVLGPLLSPFMVDDSQQMLFLEKFTFLGRDTLRFGFPASHFQCQYKLVCAQHLDSSSIFHVADV